MTGLVEALVAQFEVQDHFSDISAGEFYILVDKSIEVREEHIQAACDEYNYGFRGMEALQDDWKELKEFILG